MQTKIIRNHRSLFILSLFCLVVFNGCPGRNEPLPQPLPEKRSSETAPKPAPNRAAEIKAERERLEKISDATPGLWGFKHYYRRAKGFESTPASGLFYLDLHDHTQYDQQLVAEGSLLRELPRQALLLSAREEFGLRTRDRALREEFPWARGSGKFWPLSVVSFVTLDFKATISVIRHHPNGVDVLWTSEHDLGTEDPYGQLTAILERISREEFAELLVKEGFARVERKQGESSPLPDDVEESLDLWNDVAQFAAVRQLHELMQTSGETPEILAGLARGYAQLAELTALYYSSMHKAFQARALLYAERLVRTTNATPMALWHRAYVQTLIGLPEAALKDIEQALSNTDETYDAPWCSIIHLYCQGDFRELDKLRKEANAHPLAAFLYLDIVRYLANSEDFVEAAETAIQVAPEALRPQYDLWSYKSLGTKRSSTNTVRNVAGIQTRHLGRVPGLGETTKRLLETEESVSPDKYQEIVLSLKESGLPDSDPHELSLDALGQILREAGFKSTWTYLYFLKSWLAVPVEEEFDAWRPFIVGHPFEAAANAYVASGEEQNKLGRAWILRIDRVDFEYPCLEVLVPLYNTSKDQASRLNRYAWRHCDYTSHELQVLLKSSMLKLDQPKLLAHLKRVSPRELKTISSRIALETEESQDQLSQWEEEFTDVSYIQRDLVWAYRNQGNLDGAERCLERLIKIHPTFETYQELAHLHSLRGDDQRWLQASLFALRFPVPGLEGVGMQQRIARHYRDRGDWRMAIRHADQAAGSYAGGSMGLASEIHQQRGNWKKAEEYLAASARRYESWATQWLKWCRRTGRGDVDSALSVAQKWAADVSKNPDLKQKAHLIEFYELTNQLEKAYELRAQVARKEDYSAQKWHAFIMADELKKEEDREEFLKMLLEGDPTEQRIDLKETGPLTNYFLTCVSDPNQELDHDRINDLMARLPRTSSILMSYFIGRYLLNHDMKEEANYHLRNAAASTEDDYGTPLAAIWLLRQQEEVVPDPDEYGSRHWSSSRSTEHPQVFQQKAPVTGVRFLKDRSDFALWDQKGRLSLRNTVKNSKSIPLRDADGQLFAVTHDATRWVFQRPFSHELEIWNRDEADAWKVLPQQGAKVFGVQFDPQNSHRLLCGDCRYLLDKHPRAFVSYYDLEEKKELWRTELEDLIPAGLFFLSSDEFLVYGKNRRSQGWCGIFSRETGEQLRFVEINRHEIESFDIARNGEYGVSHSPHGEIVIWGMKSLSPVSRLWRQDMTAVALSPNADLLVIGQKTGQVTFHDWKNDRILGSFDDHQQAVTQIHFHDDGQQLLSASNDYSCRLWDIVKIQQPSNEASDSSPPLIALTNSIGMSLLPVPAGEFLMGERENYEAIGGYKKSKLKQERPRHRVVISRPYYLSQTEVTVGEFRKFVEATNYVTVAEKSEQGGEHLVPPEGKLQNVPGSSWRSPGFEQGDDHPVVMIAYEDALAFCQWLSEVDGANYRLPTEAEWEKACRAGTESSWWFGNDPYKFVRIYANNADTTIRELYNYYNPSWERDDRFAFTAPVGSFPPNPYGFYDMHGNVWEWCQDWFSPEYYENSPETDPPGPDAGEERTLRSGCFFNYVTDSRSAYREGEPPKTAMSGIGFRVLREVSVSPSVQTMQMMKK
ncbi:MAG TPA: SUMF1/EgtB/PvdO family nonheme iron enzyme [Planctomicrobium sp.]|nr:SUMF1/EgtB/PvdO family nonheme iron enzyme [Planctomicrobium sp.]